MNFYEKIRKELVISIPYAEEKTFVQFVKKLYEKGWRYWTDTSSRYSTEHPFIKILYSAGVIATNNGAKTIVGGAIYPPKGISRGLFYSPLYPILIRVGDEGVAACFKEGCSREQYLQYLGDIIEAYSGIGGICSEWLRAEMSEDALHNAIAEVASLQQELSGAKNEISRKNVELAAVRQAQRTKEEIARAIAESLIAKSELALVDLKLAVRKAIAELVATKGISKSRKFAQIRKDLEAALDQLPAESDLNPCDDYTEDDNLSIF